MRLLKSLLLGASLASYFVNALPSQFPEPNVSERDDIQLLSRDGNVRSSIFSPWISADIVTQSCKETVCKSRVLRQAEGGRFRQKHTFSVVAKPRKHSQYIIFG